VSIRWSEEDLQRFRPRLAAGDALIPEKRHKYGARRTEVDGILFDSKAEAAYYEELKVARAKGGVAYFLRQVPFTLPGNTVYRCDFMVVKASGEVKFVDVKGHVTPMFRTKKRQVEALYPVRIRCVKRQGGRFIEIEV